MRVRSAGVAGLVVAALAAAGLAGASPAVAAPSPAAPGAQPFTLVVVPDIQNYTSTSANRAIANQQTQWIADTRSQLNTVFVTQVGDLVGINTNATQWQAASTAMANLDNAGVPNTVLPGNHDLDLTTGAAPEFQQYFPVSRYANASWNSPTASYGGYMGQNQFGPDPVDRGNMNNYALFSTGGMDFLLLSLEFNTPDYTIDWARKVLAAYPDRRVILSTHSFVDFNGRIATQMDRGDGGNSPQQLWDKLVSPNCSIFMVVNGHFHNGEVSEARRTDTNSCGKPVQSVLSDYQDRARGGNGWLRYYTFVPASNEIRASTYSPFLSQFETDADSAFTLPYDMGGTGQPPTTAIAADGFERTTANGWGSAEVGGSWTTTGTASRFSVSGGRGVQSVPAGATLGARLSSVSSTATDLGVRFSLDAVTNATTYLNVAARVTAAGEYGSRVKIAAGGGVTLTAARGDTDLTQAVVPGLSASGGQPIAVRSQVEGTSPTTIRARAWPAAGTEPSTWNVTTTDATAGLQTGGGLRLGSYLSSSATTGPAMLRFDDLRAVPIGSTPPPANQAPVASFTATTNGLTAALDGTGSTDADGTVTAWSWAFGDGTGGTGATVSHPYAAAGTYPVTLTVTDDKGATATRTTNVTVTAPPPPPPPTTALAADSFTRTLASGWGTADTGGAWTVSSASRHSVAGGSGVQSLVVGGTLTAALTGVSSARTDLTASFALDTAPDGPVYVNLGGRVVGVAEYSGRVKVLAGGAVQLVLMRDGTSLVAATLPGVTLSAGQRLSTRVQVVGTAPTTLRVRAWPTGTTEPTTWALTTTDATAGLQAAGSVRLTSYLSSSTTTGPTSIRWDDVSATPVP